MPYDVHSLIGKRVRLSAEGRKALERHENLDRVGTVVGKSRNGLCSRVLWDGLVCPCAYAFEFIEPTGDETVDFTDLGPAMTQAGLHEKAETASSSALVLAQKVVELNAKVAALQDRVDDLEKKLKPAELDPHVHLDPG